MAAFVCGSLLVSAASRRLEAQQSTAVSRSELDQALGGYLKAAQAVIVTVDAAEHDAPSEAQRLLGEVSEELSLLRVIGLGKLQRRPTTTQLILLTTAVPQYMRPGTILALCCLQVACS